MQYGTITVTRADTHEDVDLPGDTLAYPATNFAIEHGEAFEDFYETLWDLRSQGFDPKPLAMVEGDWIIAEWLEPDEVRPSGPVAYRWKLFYRA